MLMGMDRKPTEREDLRRTVERARKAAHQRLAERQAKVSRVLERSDRVQERLRRASG